MCNVVRVLDRAHGSIHPNDSVGQRCSKIEPSSAGISVRGLDLL